MATVAARVRQPLVVPLAAQTHEVLCRRATVPPRVSPTRLTLIRTVGHHLKATIDTPRTRIGPTQVPGAVATIDGTRGTPTVATKPATAPHVRRRPVPTLEIDVVVTTVAPVPTRVRAKQGLGRPDPSDVVTQVADALPNVVHVAIQDARPGSGPSPLRQVQGEDEVLMQLVTNPALEVAEGPRVPAPDGP